MHLFLILLLLLVIVYKLYTLKEGLYNSVNPCFDSTTPYIKFDNMVVCFDKKDRVEDTLDVFYGKDKNCYIDPKKNKMLLFDKSGKVVDIVTDKVNKVCKPYKVSITSG
jgi:hypothetical protein